LRLKKTVLDQDVKANYIQHLTFVEMEATTSAFRLHIFATKTVLPKSTPSKNRLSSSVKDIVC